MTRKHKLLPLAVGVAVLAALAGCASSQPPQQSTPKTESVALKWWTWNPDQAAAYQQCIPGFEKTHPGVTVTIEQYDFANYSTKLTAGFLSGDAPDGFMSSSAMLGTFAGQHQLLSLEDLIAKGSVKLKDYFVGADAWKYKDGKQYGLPMDWGTGVLYYNESLIQKAGYSDADMSKLDWTAADGGSLFKAGQHLTVDRNGVRGDQGGFNSGAVATYGLGNLETTVDPLGQNHWGWLLPSDGIQIANRPNWATEFRYGDARVQNALSTIRSFTNHGYSPALGQYTTADAQQLGSGSVAMVIGGTWSASTYAALPGVKVGIAPLPSGPNGKRDLMTNANGNVIWAGSKHPDQAWNWISYQESAACQTTAAQFNLSFLPSRTDAMNAVITSEKKNGLDLSVLSDYIKKRELVASPVYDNSVAVTNAVIPQMQAYFTGKAGTEALSELQKQTAILLKKQ